MKVSIKFLFILTICLNSHAQDDFDSFEAKPETLRVKPGKPSGSGVTIKAGGSRKQLDSSFQVKETQKYDNQEASVFGRETKIGQKKKEKKYVNLNPETAFGPEIIKSFDFPNSDVLEITKYMQKLTGINLILDNNVKGKVSISAPTPITVGDAWKAYLTALSMNSLALVKEGEFYRIINARDIRYTPTKIYTGDYVPDVENYMMKIIALKHVDANEIVRNFRPFMSRYGRILDIKQTNTIIVTDTGTNINRLMKLVKFLDISGHQESMHILEVKNTSAQELAKLLESIIKDDTSASSSRSRRRTSSTDKSKTGSVISKIIAEPRTNTIIAMANAAGAKHLKSLLAKLDVSEVAQRSEKIHVYYVQHGTAETLSQTLNSLISNASTGNSRTSGRTSTRTSRRATNTSNEKQSIFNEEVKITADKDTNTLVVTASQTDWFTLKSVLNKLDIPRMQVYVKGIIMETNVGKTNTFGTSYIGAYGNTGKPTAGFNAGSLLGIATANATNITSLFNNAIATFGAGNDVTLDIGGESVKVKSVNGAIQALASADSTNVLATPQLLVLDNSEGTFEVGETVPITNSVVGTNGTAANSSGQQNVTMKIKIKPQINKATRFIKLNIDQNIEDISGRGVNTATGGVATTIRSAVTEVIVRDQDTIAMGGLLRDKDISGESKIPILGDLPVLGWLFKSKTTEKSKTNLLMFLTPKILSPYDNVAAQNSIDVIDERNKNVRTGKRKLDPHKLEIDDIRNTIKNQVNGPLYTQEQARLYNNELNLSNDDLPPEMDPMMENQDDSLTIDDIEPSNTDEIDFIESEL